MTFPLGRDALVHPSLPKRPRRPVADEPEDHPTRHHAKVYFELPLREPGLTRQISATTDRLHVRMLKHGQPQKSFRFSIDEVPILAAAIERSKTSDNRVRNVGTIRLPLADEARIELGARAGAVLMRMSNLTNSRGSCITLTGSELRAFEYAVSDFLHNNTAT